MIKGLRGIIIRFVAFTVVSILLGAVLLNTMFNGLHGDTRGYHAEFADVAGLRSGDDVRVAGVRVGRVEQIAITAEGAMVDFDLIDDQPLLDDTRMVMRYQNLLGQRYLALVQGEERGTPLAEGSTVPLSRTSPGFDLTELLNGFRPLFEALRPDDVNRLASSMVKVLQGEGGTVADLLAQTAELTTFLADRDDRVGQVVDNLTPVLENLAGQGDQLRGTVQELRALVTGLAKERTSIGESIAGMSTLIGSTSQLLEDLRKPTPAAVARFRKVMELFVANQEPFVKALSSFGGTLAALGRASSYENAANIYFCSVYVALGDVKINLNGQPGPFSEVCR